MISSVRTPASITANQGHKLTTLCVLYCVSRKLVQRRQILTTYSFENRDRLLRAPPTGPSDIRMYLTTHIHGFLHSISSSSPGRLHDSTYPGTTHKAYMHKYSLIVVNMFTVCKTPTSSFISFRPTEVGRRQTPILISPLSAGKVSLNPSHLPGRTIWVRRVAPWRYSCFREKSLMIHISRAHTPSTIQIFQHLRK